MSTFEIVCVTNRKLCRTEFLERLEKLAQGGVDKIILREKDLEEEAYLRLARQALALCGEKLVVHSFPSACRSLGIGRLHIPLRQLERNPAIRQTAFRLLGVSVHSPEEAQKAQALGAAYLTAGHIFDTACKQGLPGRGLAFLQEVCAAVSIPVYAIGGITAHRLSAVRAAGAAGACFMSSFMDCTDTDAALSVLRRSV